MASATTDRRMGLTGDKGMKAPVDCATTANITLSGEQTIDGVLTSASRVLVKNQTTTTQNGYYDSSSAAWTRCIDANGYQDLVNGTICLITGGTQAGQFWRVTSSNPITIGTSAITFAQTFTSANISAYIATFITAANAAAARAVLGSTTVGDAVFVAANAAAARSAMGSGAIGDALFTATTAAGAQSTLGVVPSTANDFRLTLTTGVPVTTSDVLAATTIYASPFRGHSISLYDGVSAWSTISSAEFSIALGTLTSGRPHDIFCYNNAGVATLELLSWTNTATRATALVMQDGILCKTGALTRRYLGTFYTTSTTTTEDSEANRYLYNYYNQVDRILSVVDTTDSWGWTTATWRQARGSTANQFNSVIGVADTMVEVDVHGSFTNAGGAGAVGVGVGVNSTTVNSAKMFGGNQQLSSAGASIDAKYRGYPAVGLNTFAWLEISVAGGVTTFYGDSGTTLMQSGMMGKFKG